MGKDLEAQRNPHQEYIEAIEKIMELDVKIGFTPYLWVWFIRYEDLRLLRQTDIQMKIDTYLIYIKNLN